MTTRERPGQGAPTSLRGLRRGWHAMGVPALDELVGDLAASFLPPLGRLAPAGLALVGLPRWWGKRFALDVHDSRGTGGEALHGVNLLRPPGRRHAAPPFEGQPDGAPDERLVETLPMTAWIGPSLADGRPAVVVSYARDAPRPWRWVRDEIRRGAGGPLVGMTYVDLPGLRRAGGTPFLLRRCTPVTDHRGDSELRD